MAEATDTLLPDRRGQTLEAARWVVEFKPTGDGPPMANRMRAMLKAALRAYGLKAVAVRDPKPAEATVEDPSPGVKPRCPDAKGGL